MQISCRQLSVDVQESCYSNLPVRPADPPPLPRPCSIEAALAGRSFVPAWDRLQQEAPNPGQPLVLAEALQCDSGTEGGCWAGGEGW